MNIDFKFYAITDRKQTNENLFFTQIEEAIELGVRAIQIREKDLSPRELFDFCLNVQTLIGTRDVKLLVNDRCDIAAALGLDGVHLTEKSIPIENARKILGPDRLIGVSTHSIETVSLAETGGADFVVLGPIAETQFKPKRELMTMDRFKTICELTKIPVFALGGITPDNAESCINAGAQGVAGISLWMHARGMRDRLTRLKTGLRSL